MHKLHGAFIKMHKYYIKTVFAFSNVAVKIRNFQAEANSEYLKSADAYFVTVPDVI